MKPYKSIISYNIRTTYDMLQGDRTAIKQVGILLSINVKNRCNQYNLHIFGVFYL